MVVSALELNRSLERDLTDLPVPDTFGETLRVDHADGTKTFIGSMRVPTPDTTIDVAYFMDFVEGEIACTSELVHPAGESSMSRWTETKEEKFEHKGIAERQLGLLNWYSLLRFKSALYSHPRAQEAGIGLWEKLVRTHRAEAIKLPSGDTRYRFLK